jgi:hypothetical protein
MRGFPCRTDALRGAALWCYFKMALTGQTAVGRRSEGQVTPAFTNAGWSWSRAQALTRVAVTPPSVLRYRSPPVAKRRASGCCGSGEISLMSGQVFCLV